MHALERQFLEQARVLWRPKTPLLVGVSGGIDSMALFALLHAIQQKWPVDLQAVHIDHGLRIESADDAAWLKMYIKDVFSHQLTVVPVTVVPDPGESVEMAARRVRYRALMAAADQFGPEALVAVAHHKNDQAETVLMRIITGTGVRGLAAMRPLSGRVVRPLLAFSRNQLQHYLIQRQVQWRDDPSNKDARMLRNHIRHQILPLLADVNPAVVDALYGLAERASRHEEALEAMLDGWLNDQSLSYSDGTFILSPQWAHWPREITALVLRRYAESHGVRLSSRHLELAFRGGTDWPGGYRVDHLPDGRLRVLRPAPVHAPALQTEPVRLPRQGTVAWADHVLSVEQGLFEPTRSGWGAINANRWPQLWVRAWRPGDRIRPLGLQGHSKKVQDIFVDAKVPKDRRDTWPVLVDSPDSLTILAIPGLSMAEEARADARDPVHWVHSRPLPQ